MTILEKQADLLEAIHKKIPNRKEARTVVNQLFDELKNITNNQKDLDLNYLEQLKNDDIISDTSFSDNMYKSNIAIAMSQVNEFCHQYNVAELFPNITPDSQYNEYHKYVIQYTNELLEDSKKFHEEYDKIMKQMN